MGTSSIETSSSSGTALSGNQDREVDWTLGFLRTGREKGWSFRFLDVGEEGSRSGLWCEGSQGLQGSGLLGSLESKD